MKIKARKTTIYIVLASLLLLSCIRINNVKLIMDRQALLGFELDLSDVAVSLRGTAPRTTDTDIAAFEPNNEEAASRP